MPSAFLLPLTMSILAGSMIVLQAPINARLGDHMGGPLVAAFFSFFTGTILLGCVLLALRKPILLENISLTSPWMWIGGTLGTMFVFTTIFVVPKLGAAGMIALIICGQILFSLIVDHYGFLLPQSTPISPVRIAGAVLLIISVAMIMAPKF